MSEHASLYESVFSGCPVEWEIVPFADAINFQEGPGILAKDFREEGVPLLRLRNIERPFVDLVGCNFLDPDMVESRWPHFRVVPGDLLVSTSGTLGRVSIATQASAGSIPYTGIIRMRPARVDVDAGFIRYFLMSPLFQLQAEASAVGSVLRHFGPSHLREMSFPVPSSNEQRTIAGVLGALDDRIEQNRRTARALERLAQAIFRAWFVDFEPVKAKAAGAVSFPSMPQAIFDALPTHFIDTEIGAVPDGWEVGGTPNIATLSKVQVNPREHANEVFDHFSIPAFDADTYAVVEFGEAIKSNKFLVSEGCVLLSKLNPRIARIWLPPPPRGRRQVASTEFLVFVPKSTFDRHYIYCQFQQSSFREELAQSASGTSNSHQRVRPDDVLHKSIIVPPSPVRKGFADITDPLFALSTANHTESAKLTEVRDYLLPRLVGGQVRMEVTHA